MHVRRRAASFILLVLIAHPVAPFTASSRMHEEEQPELTRAERAIDRSDHLKGDGWVQSLELAAAHLTEDNLKVVGVGCAVAGGILCLSKDVGTGLGWVTAGGVMAWSSRLVAKQRISNGLATTAKRLAVQNAELDADLSALKSVVNKFGHSASDIEELVKTLGATWASYKKENERHAELLDSQARLQLLQLMQQFDADRDSALDAAEQRDAEAYLLAAFPRADLSKKIGNHGSSWTLGELESMLLEDALSNVAGATKGESNNQSAKAGGGKANAKVAIDGPKPSPKPSLMGAKAAHSSSAAKANAKASKSESNNESKVDGVKAPNSSPNKSVHG